MGERGVGAGGRGGGLYLHDKVRVFELRAIHGGAAALHEQQVRRAEVILGALLALCNLAAAVGAGAQQPEHAKEAGGGAAGHATAAWHDRPERGAPEAVNEGLLLIGSHEGDLTGESEGV